MIDVYLEDIAEKETHELESMSSKDNDNEDLDLESPSVLQEWMMEYEKSCRQLMATYNAQETFSYYCEQSERLCNMKYEYNRSPTDDLLLETFHQNHLANTLDLILREWMKEEKSSMSKEVNEQHPNQHQRCSEK